MEEELGGTFVVAVDELGLNGLWSTIKDLVEARVPLQGLTLPNKVAKAVNVPDLPLMFVLSTDKRLLHLKQYSHSPVTWFRNPMTHLVLVSTADLHEYRSTTRAHLKRVTSEIEKDWGGGTVGSEWLILYVRPFELEAADKGARKVYEKLCDDFGSKRRERVVRLDVPLRAFDGPTSTTSTSSSSSRPGACRLTATAAAGTFVGPGGTALAAGLDDLCAGLRDSIRAAFETRKMAYDAEVRRLHNERRDPKWSFTTLYLVKDSFALMLEGAGLWEDAFQEYVELETVYLDCLDAANQGLSNTGGVGAHTDFGLSGHESEDVATLLTSSWRTMRGLVLRKRNVQEFQFRQYLFAAQARVLLRLNRPVDVAERGLVFIQNFLTLLAAKEAAGQIKPWFKECWAFSACMSLITAVTTFMAKAHDLPTDWEVNDLVTSGGAPTSSTAQAAMRQMTAAVAAVGGEGAGHADRPRPHAGGSPTVVTSSSITAPAASSASMPVLPASAWQLGPLEADASLEGGSSSSGTAAAAAAADEDVPPLDLALLCGRAILPGNVALLLQEGEPRRELMDKLYCCLLGHLYHLARGELLRLGSALQLPEAAAANASILQLGKAAFSPPKLATTGSSGSPRSPRTAASSSSPVSKQARVSAAGLPPNQLSARGSLTAGVDLLLQASAAGSLSPRMVAQLQELFMTPLCGFSMMINKYADGSSNGLTYEVHTPRLDQDPLAAVLHRADSQSTPYPSNHTAAAAAAAGGGTNSPRLQAAAGAVAAAANSPRLQAATAAAGAAAPSPFSRSSGSSSANTPTAASAAGSSSVLDRLRRVGSSSGSITGSSGAPAAAAAAATGAGGQQQQQQSRLSKVTGDASQDDEASSAVSLGVPDHASSSMRRQDSSASLATVNFGGNTADGGIAASFSGGQAGDVDFTDDISLSGASVTGGLAGGVLAGDAASLADSASSLAVNGQQAPRPSHLRTQSAIEAGSGAAAAGGAAGASSPNDLLSVTLPKVITHVRSASALPATTGAAGEAAAAAAEAGGVSTSSKSAAAAVGSPTKAELSPMGGASSATQGLRSRRAAAPAALQPSAATAAAAAAVPGWVREWRLQLALRSPACFQELVLGLSRRAAWCYAKAGRVRSSALIYADVAVLALQRGQLDAAASLLDRMHHIFTSEGWQQLLGALLPKLLACQSLAAAPTLPFTALRLLALTPGAAAAADRQAAYDELLAAVGAPPLLPAAATAVAAAAAAVGGVNSNSSTVQLATLSAIQMRPAPGTYSHFFGHEVLEPAPNSSSSSDELQQRQQQLMPVLSPPARPLSSSSLQQGGGAALLVVGDSLPLAVDVISALPAPVLLQRPVLSLVQLHKSTWISSTTSNVASSNTSIYATSSGFGRGSGLPATSEGPAGVLRSGGRSGFIPSQAKQQGFAGVWDAIKGGGGLRNNHESPRDDNMRWQEGEELLATRLLAAFSPGSSDGSSDGSSSSSGGCQLLPDGSVLLTPGVNRLVFRVAPIQSGLYCLKQLRALLGVCGELIIGMPPPGSLSILAAAADLSNSSSRRAGDSSSSSRQGAAAEGVTPCASAELAAGAGGIGGADVTQMGGVTSSGAVVSEVVVARVVDPAPRVRLTPVVPEGSLPVGTTAWLGLLVTPRQNHTLLKPRLHLQPNRNIVLAAAAAAAGGVSLGQQQQQQLLGLGASSSSSEQQQQQQVLLGGLGPSSSQLTAASTSSSSVGLGGPLQQQQQLAQYVFVTPLQQQQVEQQVEQQQQQVAGAGDSLMSHQQPEMSHRPEGRWLPLRRGCVDLSELLGPEGVLSVPLLVWMQVVVGCPPSPHATLSVAALPQPATAGSPPAAAAAAAVSSKVVPEPCVLLASRAEEAVADMVLQLEYTADAGVWRSHASSMQLPLQQPVNITATALQLPSGAVAVNVTLSLDPSLRSTFVLHQAGLRPQFGLVLGPGFSSSGFLQGSSSNEGLGSGSSRVGLSEAVPLVLVPGGAAGLSFLLLPDQGDKLTGSFEADGCNMLLLSYSLNPYGPPDVITAPGTDQVLPQPPALLDTQPTGAAAAADGAGGAAATAAASSSGGTPLAAEQSGVLAGGSSCSNVMTLQLPFWLEFPSVRDASPAAASVRVTLLGPYSGRMGQPVTLSWQLARITSSDAADVAAAAAEQAAFTNVALGSDSQAAEAAASDDAGDISGQLPPVGSSAEADELLCYELLFGQQQKHEAGKGADTPTSRAAAAATAGAGNAAAAAAADMGGASGSANAALFWGVSGAVPSGVVRLGRAPGSLAVVEVVLWPRATGRVSAPQLVLKSPGGHQVVLVEGGAGHISTVTVSR